MRRLTRILTVGALLLTTTAAAACTTAGSPPLTDARDVLTRGLQSTAALQTVHAALELRASSGANTFRITLGGDIDFAARELAFVLAAEPDMFGTSRAELVIADRFTFSRSDENPWTSSGDGLRDPLDGVPTTAAIAAVTYAAVADSRSTVALETAEECGSATCYRVSATIPPAVSWAAIQSLVPGGGQPAQPPPEFPPLSIDAWIEYDSFRLLRAVNTVEFQGQTGTLTIELSDHNAQITIERPIDPTSP